MTITLSAFYVDLIHQVRANGTERCLPGTPTTGPTTTQTTSSPTTTGTGLDAHMKAKGKKYWVMALVYI